MWPTTTWEIHGLINTWTIYLTQSMGLETWFHKNKRHQNDKVGNQSISLGGFLESVSKKSIKKWQLPLLTQKWTVYFTQAVLKILSNEKWGTCFNIKIVSSSWNNEEGNLFHRADAWNLIENSHKLLWIVSERHGTCTVWIRNRFMESVCKRLEGCIK